MCAVRAVRICSGKVAHKMPAKRASPPRAGSRSLRLQAARLPYKASRETRTPRRYTPREKPAQRFGRFAPRLLPRLKKPVIKRWVHIQREVLQHLAQGVLRQPPGESFVSMQYRQPQPPTRSPTPTPTTKSAEIKGQLMPAVRNPLCSTCTSGAAMCMTLPPVLESGAFGFVYALRTLSSALGLNKVTPSLRWPWHGPGSDAAAPAALIQPESSTM